VQWANARHRRLPNAESRHTAPAGRLIGLVCTLSGAQAEAKRHPRIGDSPASRSKVLRVRFGIDEAELVQALDRCVLPTLPTEWPGSDAWSARSTSVSDHFEYLDVLELHDLTRDAAIDAAVEAANIALFGFSDGVSEDAREPYNGIVTIAGDLLRVRFGRVPRSNPDPGDLAPELEPIPISDILVEE
jgi:hypothetical protein